MPNFGKRKFWKAKENEDPNDYDPATSRYEVKTQEEGTYVGSEVDLGYHWPAIDIDCPIWIRESSPGKFHLFIDKDVPELIYFRMLGAMVDAGIVEPGYYAASVARGQTMLRLRMSDKYGEGARFVMNDSRNNVSRYLSLAERARASEARDGSAGTQVPADAGDGADGDVAADHRHVPHPDDSCCTVCGKRICSGTNLPEAICSCVRHHHAEKF